MDKRNLCLLTYDENIDAAYLYLNPKQEGPYSQEFVSNHEDILMDFNNNDQLIGVEFLPPSSHILKYFAGKGGLFKKVKINDSHYFYEFKVDDVNTFETIWLKNQKVAFLFTQAKNSNFLGIQLYDIAFYSEE